MYEKTGGFEDYAFCFLDDVKQPVARLMAIGKQSRENGDYYWDNSNRNKCVIFQYTLKGSGTVKTSDGEFIVDEGKGFFLQMPANECYFFDEEKNSAPWEFIYILFDPTLVEDYCRYIENRFGKIIALPLYSRAIRQLLSIYDSAEQHMQNPFLMSSMVFEFLCLLCNETGSAASKRGSLPDKAKKIIDENCNSQISIYDVSVMLNVSQSHLSREFFKAFGVKPIEYLTKQRLKNAVSLIGSSELNLESVSKSCGFSSSGYFSKVFKKYMRMSPAQFKKYVRAEGYSKIKI